MKYSTPAFLSLIRCPLDHSALRYADAALEVELNDAIGKGTLLDHLGRKVTQKIDGALVRADGAVAYPVFEGIPMLLSQHAIPLGQLNDPGNQEG